MRDVASTENLPFGFLKARIPVRTTERGDAPATESGIHDRASFFE